jgi:3-hydroxy-9,10-secoandrosta-1,3,5(10)-triene-9,17-dione monooxygenase reductase component
MSASEQPAHTPPDSTLDAIDFRNAMSRLPTGVSVVTAAGDAGPAGLTVGAVASLSLEPALMLACLDRGSRTLAAVERTGRFGVNVLAAHQADLARSFASKAPHPEKWAPASWEEHSGVPIIDGVVIWAACGLRDLHDGGDHVVATGTVLELAANDLDPLVFYRGEYMSLGEAP